MASNEHPGWRSHGQEAKIGWTGGQRIPGHGEAHAVVSAPVCATGVSLIASGCLIGATAERAVDGGVVDVSRALSVSPRAP